MKNVKFIKEIAAQARNGARTEYKTINQLSLKYEPVKRNINH